MGFLDELRAAAAHLRAAPLPFPQLLRRPFPLLFLPGSEIDANPLRTKSDQLQAALGWVYAAATTLAQDVRAAEWALWRRVGARREDWEAVQDSQALTILERPNALQTWGDIVEIIDLHMSLTGEAYWHLLMQGGESGGRVIGIEVLYPHWVQEPIVRDGRLVAWRVQVPGRGQQDLPFDDVVFFRFPHPMMPLMGMSPVEAFAVSHMFDLYVRAYGASLFRNDGGVPAGLVTSDQELSPEQADLIRERWKERYARRWGEVAVLGKGATYQQIAIPLADVNILEWGQFSRDQILAAYKVPAAKLGLLAGEGVSRANLDAADNSYKQLALRPRLRRYQESINLRVLPRLAERRGDAGRLWFEFQDPVEEDIELRAKLVGGAVELAAATPNELRDVLGLDPRDDGNVLLLKPGVLPVTSLVGKSDDEPNGDDPPENDDDSGAGRGAADGSAAPQVPVPSPPIQTEEHLELAGLRVLDRQTPLERDLASQVRALFSKEQRAVVAAFRSEQTRAVDAAAVETRDAIDDALRGTAEDWELMLARFWARGMQVGWQLAVPQLGKRKLPWTAIQARAIEFARRMGALKVRGIQDLTRAKIRRVIARGIADGQSIDQIARALRELYDRFKGTRSITIARTETTQAVNRGHWLHAKEVQRRQGVDIRKQWVATNDGRTRPTHAEAHRQTVPLDEAFTVGGHALIHPGDPGAPIEETANCRCTEVLLFPGEEVPA